MSIIRTQDLTKRFDNFVANNKINIAVEKQEIKCIVGENGAGKTTLMNMLYGELKPSAGKILIDEEEVKFTSPLEAIGYGIGMVHQHFMLVPSMTVYENILLGIEISKKWFGRKIPVIDRQEERRTVGDLINRYGFQLDPGDRVENISVGMRQQVEILKMLYRNVRILILDEPTSVLTPQEVDRLIVTLKTMRDAGKTIIVITHKLREVMALSDSVDVIKQGNVVGRLKTSETNERELAQLMVGRDVVLTVKNDSETMPGDDIVYRVKDLCTVNEYGKQIFKNISFEVHRGEILGIAGVEGNGQIELVKVLTGLMAATGGTVKITGTDITNAWPDELRKNRIGIIPEDRYAQGLCADMSIAENCIAGHFNREICIAGIFRKREIAKRCAAYIKKYDIRLADVAGPVSQLSGGNAQKIIIAREFESRPIMIIACQPTRGVDVGSIEFIHKELLKFRNAGYSVLLVSSELSEIMSLSDRIAVMYKGEIVGEMEAKNASVSEIGLLMAGTGNGKERGHE
ncbi:MAG: ABC transporter ATP-binding protein [Spirochaetaceae bacterium]|jgi:simple sugar transport system ATP-binding protein|nr:ABC transporter ATP-binding protein [Spirochaetaceae bacterium]